MTGATIATLVAVVAFLAIACPPLGRYMAAVFGEGPAPGDRFFNPIERRIFGLIGTSPDRQQRWSAYAASVLAFSAVSILGLYLLLRVQGSLPFNPTGVEGMSPSLAFNTAISFVTGTDWQAYSGELAMSHLAQMIGLVVAQFTAGTVGLAVAIALVRGLAGTGRLIGNFWVDATRAVLRVLLPLAAVFALALVAAGTVQNFNGNESATTVEGAEQLIPGGPVATQVVAKTMASNGGGFYNSNSAHPFDNPTGLTNAIQLMLCLVLPIALLFTFGHMVGNRRQGRALVGVVAALWIIPLVIGIVAETSGNPALPPDVDQAVGQGQEGGNMEGKEVRFGPGGSTLLTLGSMGTTSGIASSAIGSYTPPGQGSALGPILLSEVGPGGVGGGLIGLMLNVLLATFMAGLMIGRTPMFLGKKVGPPEVKLIMLATLIVPVVVLTVAAWASISTSANATVSEPGAQGFSEMLYAAASATNGNGSALGGLTASGTWWTTALGLAMLAGRFLVLVPALALAGAFAPLPKSREHVGTLDTASPLFAGLVIAVVIIVGGLTFLPAFCLSILHAAL